jgi:2-phosphosulfolactate phosphatase
MSYFDQLNFDICFDWGSQAIENLATADAIVIVDVLSFSTRVDIALGRGVNVLPYRWQCGSAVEYTAAHGAEPASTRSRFADRYSLLPASMLNARLAYGSRCFRPTAPRLFAGPRNLGSS